MKNNTVIVNGYVFNESLLKQKEIIKTAFKAEPELLEYAGSFGWEQIAPYKHRWGFEYPDGAKDIIEAISWCPEGHWVIHWVYVDSDGEEIEMTNKYVWIE